MYTIDWSDSSLKPSFTIDDATENSTATSLKFVGRDFSQAGTPDWGEIITEDLLRILENNATGGGEPAHPTEGQLWFNNDTKYLYVYYNANWYPLGLRRIFSPTEPAGDHIAGDLWYDTTNNLLMVYENGGSWMAACDCNAPPPPPITVGISEAVSLVSSNDATVEILPTIYEWTTTGESIWNTEYGDSVLVDTFVIPSYSKIVIEMWGGGGGGGLGSQNFATGNPSSGGITLMYLGTPIDGGPYVGGPTPSLTSLACWPGRNGLTYLNGAGGGSYTTDWVSTIYTGLLTTLSVNTGNSANNMNDGGDNVVVKGTDGGYYTEGATVQEVNNGGHAYIDSVGGLRNSVGAARDGTGYGAGGAGGAGSVSPFGLGGGGGGGGQYVHWTYLPATAGQRGAILVPGQSWDLYVGKGGTGQSGMTDAAGRGTPGRIRISVWS